MLPASTHRFRALSGMLGLLPAAVALALAVGVAGLAARWTDRELRAEFLQQARMIAAAIDPSQMAALSGTPADLASPDYRRIKEQLAGIRLSNPACRFLYLMSLKPDGVIVFHVDSEPADSKDCSPPGQVYDEAPSRLQGVFATGQAAVHGPYVDRWGTWVSAFIPLSGPQTGGASMVFGMDIAGAGWNRTVALRAALPVALAIVAITLGLLAAVLFRSRRNLRVQKELLRASEESYRKQFAENSSIMLLVDPADGSILDANAAALHFYGYSRERLLALRITDINTAPADEVLKAMASVSTELGKRFEFRHRLADDSVRDVEVSASCIQIGERRVLHSIVSDITPRKQAETHILTLLEESRQSRLALLRIVEDQTRAEVDLRRLAAAVEQVAETVVITDTSGTIVYANPAFEAVTGYTRAEAIGQNPRILKSGKHDEEFYRKMWTALAAGQVWTGRLVNKRKDGTLYQEDATISPVHDAAGMVINYVAVKRDVTREVALEAQSRQASKMEAVGQLAGGVAHDFNNKLQVILGSAQMLLETVPAHDATRPLLEEIQTAGRRSADLTRQLLAFSREQAISPVLLDMNDAIPGSLKMLGRLVGENIRMNFTVAPDLWPVLMDPGQFDQVMANLAANARDAISGDGVFTIQAANCTLHESDCRDQPEFVAPGDYVVLTFRDDGAGMPPEVREHIFEPFFTTKGVGKGTGLGLATVHGIVKQNNGAISVESEPGRGTTFTIYLPRSLKDRQAAGDEPTAQAPRGTETVLLVEDEEGVLHLVRAMLERQGYQVLTAASPRLALEVCERYADPIHLLLTDVIMPEMSGKALAESIRTLRPGIRVIFMSGYTAEIMKQHGGASGNLAVLQKPFTNVDLAQRVRMELDRVAPTAPLT